MKNYLTISEFAELRNVNINSIRYYEKQKILIPAWIDPQTKYRYYLPEQLGVLDAILLCIRLGIPLKELKSYIDQNGKLDEKGILEKGREMMQKEIAEMQTGLEITQFNLVSMEQNEKYSDQNGVYTREIEERFLFQEHFDGDWDDLIHKEKAAMTLFRNAQEQNMAPVFPAGILIHCDTEPISYSLFIRVLRPAPQDKHIIHIPTATFSCLQTDLTPHTDILKVLKENFSMNHIKTVIISNMTLSKYHFDSRHSEIQIPQFTPVVEDS